MTSFSKRREPARSPRLRALATRMPSLVVAAFALATRMPSLVVAAFALAPCTAIAAFAAAVFCSCAPDCGPAEAIVERVLDGDTIIITGGLRLRYLLVDAPEATGGRDECYGANAAQLNADLVLGKTIQLTYDVECHDPYDRLLAYVTVDGTDVNQLLVERGHACVLHIPPSGASRVEHFRSLEAAAKIARRGLWGACDPAPCH